MYQELLWSIMPSIHSKDKGFRQSLQKKWENQFFHSNVKYFRDGFFQTTEGPFDWAESLKNCLSSFSKCHSTTRLTNVALFPCKAGQPELPQMGMDWRDSHLVPDSGGLWPHLSTYPYRLENEEMLYWRAVYVRIGSNNHHLLSPSCWSKLLEVFYSGFLILSMFDEPQQTFY